MRNFISLRFGASLAALIVATVASAQSNSDPHVDVRFAEDRTLGNDQLRYWAPANFPGGSMVGSVGLELSATPQDAARTWVIIIGRVHLKSSPEHVENYQQLIEDYPWLAEIVGQPFSSLIAAPNGALSGIASRFLPSDLAALANREIKIAPGPLAAILDSSTASKDGIRGWGQPFLTNQLGADGKYRFVWRCFNDFWVNSGWAPGGQSNWYWSSTFSRVREGSFADGKHLLSINRITETLITYQGSAESSDPMAGYNFLNSSDYNLALATGLVVTLQVISVRGSQYDPNNGWGPNPLIIPGTFLHNGELLGLSISEPLVLNPVLNSPPFNSPPPGEPFTYAVSPASAFGLVPGGPTIIAVGQSSHYTHARFQSMIGGTTDAQLSYLHPFSGLATLIIPDDALPGVVEWYSVIPTYDWSTAVVNSFWPSIGSILEATDAVAPLP